MAAIYKTLPTNYEEFDEFRLVKSQTSKKNSSEPSECAFGQALELNAAEGEMSRHVEVKNEQLGQVDVVRPLAPYSMIVHLDISMNKIAAIKGGFD